MKMNSGKRSGSRWAFGGLAVLLGVGGILTFGTPGGEQAGCGGGYYDEDIGELVVDDAGAGKRAQHLSFSPGGVAPGSPGYVAPRDLCRDRGAHDYYRDLYSITDIDLNYTFYDQLMASPRITFPLTADSFCDEPPDALHCMEVRGQTNRDLFTSHCDTYYEKLKDAEQYVTVGIDDFYSPYIVGAATTKRTRTLARFAKSMGRATCAKTAAGIFFRGWGRGIDAAATVALWLNGTSDQMEELANTVNDLIANDLAEMELSKKRCQDTIGKLLKSMEEGDSDACDPPTSCESRTIKGVCSREETLCCDCADCDPCDAERAPLKVVRHLLENAKETYPILLGEYHQALRRESCGRGLQSDHRSRELNKQVQITSDTIWRLESLEEKLMEWDSKNDRTNGTGYCCVVSCEASGSSQISGQ
jgi:hypothetical protein